MTLNVKASDATFQALYEHLGAQEMVEMTLAISFYGLAARIMETFEVELEPTAGTYKVEQLRRQD